MNKRFERYGNELENRGVVQRTIFGEFMNPDVRRGRKDGRNAPDAWSFALEAIASEETMSRDNSRSLVRQKAADTTTHLAHTEYLLVLNKEAQNRLLEDNTMLTESVAYAQYCSARRDLFIAGFLTCLDAIGLIAILKKIFGGNILLIVPLGILLISAVVFGIKGLLEHQSPERRASIGKILTYGGGALVIVGLIGVALLRSVTFNAALTGDGTINAQEISLGNLLFTLGIGIGLPVVLGVWYESESAKLRSASIPLMLYREEKRLLREKTALLAEIKTMQEIEGGLDSVTLNIIRLRQNRYVRGYMKGVRRNQNARRYIEEILKDSQKAAGEEVQMLKPTGAWEGQTC